VSPGDRPAGSAGGATQVFNSVSENTPPDLMQHTSHVCAVFFMQSSYASKSHEGSSAFAMAALPTARPIANVAAARLFPVRLRMVANEIISSLSAVEVMSVPIVVSGVIVSSLSRAPTARTLLRTKSRRCERLEMVLFGCVGGFAADGAALVCWFGFVPRIVAIHCVKLV
jgi:hypothetical protein